MEFEKSKNLKCVLKEIFIGTPDARLAEIENILKEEEIYLGSHMEIVDTNALQEKSSLTNTEILKIEEYIKTYNRSGYDDLKTFKMAEEKKKKIKLKIDDEIKYYALKKNEELKFAQEKQKMIEYREDREKELMETKAKIEMDRENMKMERENELRKEIKKEEMEKVKFEWQKKMELREAKAKEETEREKMQRKIELMEAKNNEKMAKDEFKKNLNKTRSLCDDLINERKQSLVDIQRLENYHIQLKGKICEMVAKSRFNYLMFFTRIICYANNKEKDAEEEYHLIGQQLEIKKSHLAVIDKKLYDMWNSNKLI